MRVVLTNTLNAAFGEDDQSRAEEVARILEDIATKIRNGEESGNLRDRNGNTVGNWTL